VNQSSSDDRPRDRWLWLAGIIAVIVVVLLWGFQTAIKMEEGPGDDSADAAAPADATS